MSLVQIEQARSISSLLYDQKSCECSVKTQQVVSHHHRTKMADVFPFLKYFPFRRSSVLSGYEAIAECFRPDKTRAANVLNGFKNEP